MTRRSRSRIKSQPEEAHQPHPTTAVRYLRHRLELPEDYTLGLEAILAFAIERHFLESWGQPGPGQVSLRLKGKPEVVLAREEAELFLAKAVMDADMEELEASKPPSYVEAPFYGEEA